MPSLNDIWNDEDIELLHNQSNHKAGGLKKNISSERTENILPSSPLIIVTGGCSGSTAVGQFLRKLFAAHNIHHMRDVHFEFLQKHKHPRKNHWKNPFYHNLTIEAKKSSNFTLNDDEIMIKSIRYAHEKAMKEKKVMIFKANIQQFKKYHQFLEDLNPTYFGVYRQDALARCICMVKDCFGGVAHYGYPIFAENGTRTKLCFDRRFHPEVPIQVILTDPIHCINVTREGQSFLKSQHIPLVSEEELFSFEYSNSSDDLKASVDSWARILKWNLNTVGVTVRPKIIQQVLAPYQNTREGYHNESASLLYYKKWIRNYDEIARSNLTGILDV